MNLNSLISISVIGCLTFLLTVNHGYANQLTKIEKIQPRTLEKSKTQVHALIQTGPDKKEWSDAINQSDPSKVQFRWTTEYELVGKAEWELSQSTHDWKPIARGDAGLDDDKKKGYFSVDFTTVVGGDKQRPLHYYIRIVTYKSESSLKKANQSNRSLMKKSESTQINKAVKAEKPILKRREKIGLPSQPLAITYHSPGEETQFTNIGLHPELLNSMPIEIILDTLKIKGEGGDEDPYLFVFAIFADGTTVIPEVDLAAKTIRFTNSTVRILSPTKTHENVAGANVDVGVTFNIPPSTGQFKTTIRPIGVQLYDQISLSDAEKQKLRENTLVAILVIGMEEDAIPSTTAINETRNDILNTLQNELNGIVQGVTVDLQTPTELPDLEKMVADLAKSLRKRLIDRAMERGIDDFAENFKFLGFPSVIIVPGAVNADEYIGSRHAAFNYQEIMNAGSQGLKIRLQLNQRFDGLPRFLQGDVTEPIWYDVRGRVRVQQ